MNARKSSRSRRNQKENRFRVIWDEDGRAIRRKDHRRSQKMTKKALLELEGWDVVG